VLWKNQIENEIVRLAAQMFFMNEHVIRSIVDKYLKIWMDLGLNSTLKDVPKEMRSFEQGDSEEYTSWTPIESRATNEEIIEVEKKIGYPLPESFKIFIKHKHFFELYIDEASFDDYAIHSWQKGVLNPIFNGDPREFLIDKGYIPFARYSDWGMLCFNTHYLAENKEYPVVLWDHEVWDEFQPLYANFTEALIELDKKDDASRSQA
jgi:hypothetical protein